METRYGAMVLRNVYEDLRNPKGEITGRKVAGQATEPLLDEEDCPVQEKDLQRAKELAKKRASDKEVVKVFIRETKTIEEIPGAGA